MANNNHFDLTLDTLAPSGSITRNAEYMSANGAMAIVKGDATYMKVWFNENAAGTKSDTGYTGGSWIAADTSFTTEFSTAGTYYYHMVLMDDVNNESAVYDTASMMYDTADPVIDTTPANLYLADPTTGSHIITNQKSGIVYHFEYSDASPSSGVVSGVISGEDLSADIPLVLDGTGVKSGTLAFDPDVTDGLKTLSITVTDNSGRTSTAATVSIRLDTVITKPVLSLLDSTETSALGTYVNTRSIAVNLTSVDDDIVAYKIWEGNTEPSNWTNVTPVTGEGLDVTLPWTLAENDGLKTIHAKVMDGSQAVSSADDATVTLDMTAPTSVSVTSDKAIISQSVSGTNSATLSLVGTDALSGVASYTLVRGTLITDPQIDSGDSLPTTFTLTASSGGLTDDGTYTFTLFVTDNAGNTASNNCTVVYDKTNPSVSIGTLDAWYTAQFAVTVTYSDTNGVDTLYVWANSTSDDTTIPVGCAPIATTTSPQTIATSSIDWNLSQGTNYIHVKAIDAVGNASFDHAAFGYDSVAPVKPVVTFEKAAYQSTAARIRIVSQDATSGLYKMNVSGDIVEETGTGLWEDYASSKSVTLTAGDGTKEVVVLVKDLAGNVSQLSDAAETELDTSVPTGTLALFEANGTTPKPAHSPLATLSARIGYTGDDTLDSTSGEVKYQLYGDFTIGSQSASGTAVNPGSISAYATNVAYTLDTNDVFVIVGEADAETGSTVYYVHKLISNVTAAENTSWEDVASHFTLDTNTWKDFSFDSGETYQTISNMYCTSGDGNKNIYILVVDNAGNLSSVVSQSFDYDTTAPVVTVSNVDYNRVSKAHVLRRNASGTIEGKYADQVNFTFTPDSLIQAYKVCAYMDQDQAQWQDAEKTQPRVPAEEAAIPTTAGSVNMSATGLSSSAAVNAMIKGADYETALVARGAVAGSTAEGAHIVVVYVQDLAGTWSALADFTIVSGD